jgi:hypothetical protein
MLSHRMPGTLVLLPWPALRAIRPTPPPIDRCNPDATLDGNADQDDVITLIIAIAGGRCP